jgi:hypothetical protein
MTHFCHVAMTCCGVFGGYALCWAACAYRVAAVPGRGGGVAWCMLGICPDSIPLTSTGPTTCWRGRQYPTWRPATARSRSRCCTAIRGRGPPDRPPLAPDPALRRTEPPRRVAPGVRQAQPSTRPRGRTGLGSSRCRRPRSTPPPVTRTGIGCRGQATGASTGPCTSWPSSNPHDTEGRRYYRRRLAAGKTPMEARRALKRRLSDVVYRHTPNG